MPKAKHLGRKLETFGQAHVGCVLVLEPGTYTTSTGVPRKDGRIYMTATAVTRYPEDLKGIDITWSHGGRGGRYVADDEPASATLYAGQVTIEEGPI